MDEHGHRNSGLFAIEHGDLNQTYVNVYKRVICETAVKICHRNDASFPVNSMVDLSILMLYS